MLHEIVEGDENERFMKVTTTTQRVTTVNACIKHKEVWNYINGEIKYVKFSLS